MPTISIPLTQGKVALIDEEDLHLVAPYKWCAVRAPAKHTERWYARAWVNGKNVTMHRLLLDFPPTNVDHKNGDGLDNRRSENLRLATSADNRVNTLTHPASGMRGVYWAKKHNSWAVEIERGGKKVFRKRFRTLEEAARTHDEIARVIHGEFAVLNFPGEGERGTQ